MSNLPGKYKYKGKFRDPKYLLTMTSKIIKAAKEVPNLLLITAIRDQPTIWNKVHERYKDRGARDTAWKEITETVLPDYCDVDSERTVACAGLLLRKRWNNLRDSYGKYYRAKLQGKSVRPYIYASELEFLDVNMSFREANSTEYEETEDIEANSDDQNVTCGGYNESSQELPSIKKVTSIDLIRAVKKCPAIWNTAIDGYKERYTRKNAWKKVYKEVIPNYDKIDGYNRRVTGILVTKKWYNIRDCYAKNFKAKQFKKGGRSYLYEDEINFLDAVFNKTVTNQDDLDEESVSEEETPNLEGNSVFFEVDTEMSEPEPSGSNTSIINPISTESTSQEESAMSVLVNLIEKAEDEDWAFFKSITPSVKSMSEDAKFEFRIEVMNLIKRIKKNDKIKNKRMKIELDCE